MLTRSGVSFLLNGLRGYRIKRNIMKNLKAILVTTLASLFAVLTVVNMSLANPKSPGENTLDMLEIMTRAFDESEGGEGGENPWDKPHCNLCVVENLGKIVFSCYPDPDKTCKSPTKLGTTVTCANASPCHVEEEEA
jgi:hypothetical protein